MIKRFNIMGERICQNSVCENVIPDSSLSKSDYVCSTCRFKGFRLTVRKPVLDIDDPDFDSKIAEYGVR